MFSCGYEFATQDPVQIMVNYCEDAILVKQHNGVNILLRWLTFSLSLCQVSVLCVSVSHCRALFHHKDTESTEVAQTRETNLRRHFFFCTVYDFSDEM